MRIDQLSGKRATSLLFSCPLLFEEKITPHSWLCVYASGSLSWEGCCLLTGVARVDLLAITRCSDSVKQSKLLISTELLLSGGTSAGFRLRSNIPTRKHCFSTEDLQSYVEPK